MGLGHGKGQDIRRAVHPAVRAVQGGDAGVVHQHHTTLRRRAPQCAQRRVPHLFSHAVSTVTFRCRFRRLIAILGSSLGALVLSAAGVLDALMEEAGQDPHETVGDDVEIPQRQVALVELRIHEDRVDDFLHHPRMRAGVGSESARVAASTASASIRMAASRVCGRGPG